MNKFLKKFLNKYDLNNRYDKKTANAVLLQIFLSENRFSAAMFLHQAFGVQRASHPHVAWKNDLNVQFTVQLTGNLTMCPWHSWPMNLKNAALTRIRGFLNCESRQMMQLFLTAKIEVFGLRFHVFFHFFSNNSAAICSNHLGQRFWWWVAPWPASSQIPWLVPTGRWPPAERRSCHSQMVQQPANAHRDLTAKWWKMQ